MMYETCRRCGKPANGSRSAKVWGLCWWQGPSRAEGVSSDCAYSYCMWLSTQPENNTPMQPSDPRHQVLIDRWFEQGAPKMP